MNVTQPSYPSTTVTKIDVLVAEDEPLAAEALIEWVQAHPSLNFVGHASDGIRALEMAQELKPGLILLDINMPGKTGLQVARSLSQQTKSPAIVFTTAYDEHALAAFELHALDYLLKPFSQERFNEAIDHAAMQAASNADNRQSAAENVQEFDLRNESLAGLEPNNEPLHRIMVRDQGKIFPVKLEMVEYLKSDTKYTAIAYQGRQFLVRLALQAFEDRLDKTRFLKLQRSCIVNLDFVESMTPDEMSQFVVKMRDGSSFTASREVSKILRSQSV